MASSSRNQHTAQPITMQQLLTLHEQVKLKIKQWDEANLTQKTLQQRSFLKVFLQVMDKMGADVQQAEARLKNIDMEVLTEEKCMRLQKEVHFFREECVQLHKQVEDLELDVARLRKEREGLLREVKAVRRADREARERDGSKEGRIANVMVSRKASKQSAGQVSDSEDDEVLMGLIKQLQSQHPQQAINLLKTFIKNQVHRANPPSPTHNPNPPISTTQLLLSSSQLTSPALQPYQPSSHPSVSYSRRQSRQLNSSQRLSNSTSLPMSPVKNEVLQIWQQCVRTAKAKEQSLPRFLARQSKNKLLETFFGSEKLIEILRRQLFGEKCCNNWNCIYNMQTRKEEPNEEPKSREVRGVTVGGSRRTSWGRLRLSKNPKLGFTIKLKH